MNEIINLLRAALQRAVPVRIRRQEECEQFRWQCLCNQI